MFIHYHNMLPPTLVLNTTASLGSLSSNPNCSTVDKALTVRLYSVFGINPSTVRSLRNPLSTLIETTVIFIILTEEIPSIIKWVKTGVPTMSGFKKLMFINCDPVYTTVRSLGAVGYSISN